MKYNLVFTNINDFESKNTELVIHDFIKDIPKVKHHLSFEKVYRFGTGVLNTTQILWK